MDSIEYLANLELHRIRERRTTRYMARDLLIDAALDARPGQVDLAIRFLRHDSWHCPHAGLPNLRLHGYARLICRGIYFRRLCLQDSRYRPWAIDWRRLWEPAR